MRHQSIVFTLSCTLLLCVCSLVQAQRVPMMLEPGKLAITEPVEQLSENAAVFVQINSLRDVLTGANDLIMSAAPEAIIPEPFKPLLKEPNPVLAIIGMQGMGMALTPEMLEQMLGLDFSGKVALALYPTQGALDFTLCLPVSNHTNVSGLMMNIMHPQNVVSMKENEQTIYMVQVGNHSLPDTLYVYAGSNAVLISTRIERLGKLLNGQPLMPDPQLVEEIKAHAKYDLAVAVSTRLAAPFAEKLPQLRPQIDRQLAMAIGRIQRRMPENERMQLNNQVRWQTGINSFEELLLYAKAYFMGSFDTVSQGLIDLAKQPPCVSIGLDLSGDYQTLDCRVHTNLITLDTAPKPIDLAAAQLAIEQLGLPTDSLQITGQYPHRVASRMYEPWVANTRKELQARGLSTFVVDVLESCWKNELPVDPMESLADWTIKSNLISAPMADPKQFDTSIAFIRACQNKMREPFATQLIVMPRVADDAVGKLLAKNAVDQTSNLRMYQDNFTRMFQNPDPQFLKSYRVNHQQMAGGITKLEQETSIATTFGLFGFNEHELVSRRFMLQMQIPGYTMIHDGTSNPAVLKQLYDRGAVAMDANLKALLGQVPQDTRTVEVVRNLRRLPAMLDAMDQVEQLLRRELDNYIARIQAIEAMPGLTDEQKVARMQAVECMPPTFCAMRRDDNTKKLYATLPGGFAYPRPAVVPMLRQMLGNFADYASKQGGMISTTQMHNGMQQVVIKNDTRLLGRLIKELGNQITNRYLQTPDPIQALKQDFLVELDGNPDYEDVLVNPLWEMMLKQSDFEDGLWTMIDEMSAAMPQDQPRVVDVFFMDTADGSLFIDKSDQLPPVVAPSGKQGVRAFVFACGDCGNEANRFVGWLETYTPEAYKAIMTPQPNPNGEMDIYELVENGHMVASPVQKRWVKANSEAGFKIMDAIQNKCGNEAPRPCFPR